MTKCWTDKHITEETLTLPNGQEIHVFIGWDETGAHPVKVSSSITEVERSLMWYSAVLRRNKGEDY